MTETFEVGASARLKALHRMPGFPPPEGELHEHDYTIEVVIERMRLDELGMVCNLDVVAAALRDAVDLLDGKDLDVIRPAEVEAVTVEVLARWFHVQLADAIRSAGGEALAVRVWESPTAFGGYRGPLSSSE